MFHHGKGDVMKSRKVWFITGASRGMGVDFAKAALAAGHAVVATGRDTDTVEKAVGKSDNLLVVKLDVTCRPDAEAAALAAVDWFGRIDVLVNNAGNFFAGYFEELSPEDIERQLATNLIGPMNVTRAILPVMRKQRSGHIITISSAAGLAGFEFCSAYAASKFGLRVGWSRCSPRSRRSASTPPLSTRASSVRISFRTNPRPLRRDPSRITTSVESSSWHGGRPRAASRPATLPSSLAR